MQYAYAQCTSANLKHPSFRTKKHCQVVENTKQLYFLFSFNTPFVDFFIHSRDFFLLKLLDDNKDHKLESSIFYIFCFSCGTLFGGRNSILSMSRHFLEGEQNTSVYNLLFETNSVNS